MGHECPFFEGERRCLGIHLGFGATVLLSQRYHSGRFPYVWDIFIACGINLAYGKHTSQALARDNIMTMTFASAECTALNNR